MAPMRVVMERLLFWLIFTGFSCHTFILFKKCNIGALLFDRQIVIRMSHFLKSVTFFSAIRMRGKWGALVMQKYFSIFKIKYDF